MGMIVVSLILTLAAIYTWRLAKCVFWRILLYTALTLQALLRFTAWCLRIPLPPGLSH